MSRSRWIAVVVSAFVLATTVIADDRDSTRCREREFALDEQNSVALLEECGSKDAGVLLWHLDRIDQVAADLDGEFVRGTGGRGSVIYVMDTGIRADHIEFEGADGASRVIAGIDVSALVGVGASSCASSSKSLFPCYSSAQELSSSSHGTSVASIIAGRNVGVAPEASIVSVRIMNERGLTTTAAYIQALDAIVRHAWSEDAPPFRTAVINISGWTLERLGFASPPGVSTVRYSTVERKIREMVAGVGRDGRIDRAAGKRFLFVVAANNVDGGCGDDGIVDRFPAILGPDVEGVLTVGGMTAANTFWSGTCRGAVEVLAPAQGIFSATITARDHYRGRRPNHRSGTSFATPIVAGIAARLLADRPDLTPEQLEYWIRATPSRIANPDRGLADGRVAFMPVLAPITTASQHER